MGDGNFSRLEIALKEDLFDASGALVTKRAKDYFGIIVDDIRRVRVLSIDGKLSSEAMYKFQDILTHPVTLDSVVDQPLIKSDQADWFLQVNLRPGVRDNPGAVMQEVLSICTDDVPLVYSADYFAIRGSGLTKKDIEKIGDEMLANEIVQNFHVYSPGDWGDTGTGLIVPKVSLGHKPRFYRLPKNKITIEGIKEICKDRKIDVNSRDIPTIEDVFTNIDFLRRRKIYDLDGPTDIELEYICQARSDHCNHNTFQGRFNYVNKETGEKLVINNLFKEYIEAPTKKLADLRPWIKIIFHDNAGVAEFNEKFNYVVTGETHNSPSNMEAYGGSITGIVGIFRDPMGTGKGSKLIMGGYGFCVGPRNYDGSLQLKLHPRRLQDGVIEGVRDGGNKHGVPTVFGSYFEEPESLAKSLVFVYAAGLMEKKVGGKLTHIKEIDPGDPIIMSGGRVGADGIHGVTAASAGFSDSTPAGHVQIGDPYTQKKMHDLLNQARIKGLIKYITDNGGGGLSSSIGEAAREGQGALVWLDKVPLKYSGLDHYEIWISESQERMTFSVAPENLDRFMALSKLHGVESTVIGKFTDSESLRIKYGDKTCLYIDNKILDSAFPQWEFDAVWESPVSRRLKEPELKVEHDLTSTLEELLAQPNVASKEWITRQYDHEVQGTSIIKPLVGKKNDTPSDAIVIRPDLESEKGLAMTHSIKQKLGKIDTYHMVTAEVDETIRSILAVGGTLGHLTGIDNFCWPTIDPGPNNPGAEYKAAQLVRACMALKDCVSAYETPLLSGKDSMYCTGSFKIKGTNKYITIDGLPTLQFTLHSVVDDVWNCLSCNAKEEGNSIYVLGQTNNECGGGEYYKMKGHTGLNVPITDLEGNLKMYKEFEKNRHMLASVKVVKENLAVDLFHMASGGMGVNINLENLDVGDVTSNDQALFSGSTGRFIVEVMPGYEKRFEEAMGKYARKIGEFTKQEDYVVHGLKNDICVCATMDRFYKSWTGTHEGR